jgi:hypothetical protein
LTKIKFQGKNHSMFEYCPKVDRMCGFCAKSTYNTFMDRHEKEEHLLCGLISGYENRVDKLPDCWKKMTNSQKSSFSKKAKRHYEALKIASR